MTKPLLGGAVITGLHSAVDEMADEKTFKGYGPEQGYDFLLEKIIEFDFKTRGVDLAADEIFVSDGSKSDTANFPEIFSQNTKIAITDPADPLVSTATSWLAVAAH